METKLEQKSRELRNQYCKDAYDILKQIFLENPGMKMVFSSPIGYRKVTEIAPFGTFIEPVKNQEGKWEDIDTGEGAGKLLCKEHYIHGERWCSKQLDAYYPVDICMFWTNMLDMIHNNTLYKKFKEKDPKKWSEKITFELVPNDMDKEHWTIGC